MTNPAIQNDFSYYRRTLSRRKMANEVRLGLEIKLGYRLLKTFFGDPVWKNEVIRHKMPMKSSGIRRQ